MNILLRTFNLLAVVLVVVISISGCSSGPDSAAAPASDNELRFTLPVDVSLSEGHSYAPDIAIDDNGNPHIAYHSTSVPEANDGLQDVWYARSNDEGDSYEPPKNISQSPGNSQFARLITTAADNVYIVWQDNTPGFASVFLAISNDNGATFSTPPVNISEQVNINSTTAVPVIASDPLNNDRLVVGWYQANEIMIVESYDAGVTFNESLRLPVNSRLMLSLDITVDNLGHIHLVYVDNQLDANSTRQVFYSRSQHDGLSTRFTTPFAISDSEAGVLRPSIASDSNNTIFVAWSQLFADIEHEIMLSRSLDQGVSFLPPLNVSNNDGLSTMPDVNSDADDIIYLLWQDNSPGNYEALISYSFDAGETFSSGLNFAPDESGSLISAVAVNDEGIIFTTWDDNRFGPFETIAAKGAFGLPAVTDISLSTQTVSPNSDSVNADISIQAFFSEEMTAIFDIYKLDESDKVIGRIDRLVRRLIPPAIELSTSLTQVWDGLDKDGLPAVEGKYYVLVVAETAERQLAAARRADFNLTYAQSTDVPIIENFELSSDAFAPDNDGRQDTVWASANFNKDLNWTLTIRHKDDGVVVYSETGSGEAMLVIWDGVSNAGVVQLQPEGIYELELSAIDENGIQVVAPPAEVIIDLTAPEFSPPTTDINMPQTLTLDGTDRVNVNFQLTEGAVVTINIYEENNGSLIKELSRQSYEGPGPVQVGNAVDASADAILWDGSIGADGSSNFVRPGNYVFRIWIRDFAANLFAEYPVTKTVSVNAQP